MGVVTKYGVMVCLKDEFGEDHARAGEYLRRRADTATIIALIEGKAHIATDPSSFEVWFDTMSELNDFLTAVGETVHA